MSDEHERTTRSFRPGEWFGIFGEHACVILPPTEKSRVAALWEMVDDGAGFDETLDALIATGLRDLPGFVLVSEVAGETKVVLRGAARARFTTADETVDLDGSVATTWVERSLHGVTRMSVEVAEETEADEAGVEDLRLAGGLVRISRVDQPSRGAEPELVDTEPAVEALPTGPPPAEPPPAESLPAEPVPAEWAAEVEDEPTQAVPLWGGAPWAEQPAVEQPAEEQPAEDDATAEPYYEEPPIWVPRPPAPPFGPPVEPPPPPAASGVEDHDGGIRHGDWDSGLHARQQPDVPGRPEESGVAAPPVARLVFSSGETLEVDRAVLVGRAPEGHRLPSGEEPRLVTVPSPHQEVSSTHVEIRPGTGRDHGSAVVTDLGSTNGTVLVQPGLPPEDLQPHIAVQLVPGAVIDLGDGVTIQVVDA